MIQYRAKTLAFKHIGRTDYNDFSRTSDPLYSTARFLSIYIKLTIT